MIDSQRSLLGQLGELMAASYLECQGYRILRRNFRSSEGEIDVIADHRGVLAFVEVRTRLSDAYGHPLETIGARKQSRLRLVANRYLNEIDGWRGDMRFDVVGILMAEGEPVEYSLVQDAFYLNKAMRPSRGGS